MLQIQGVIEMPLYEYEREDGTRFEMLQKFSDKPISLCPSTGQKVERLISESAFHLKGSGWYKTDYKNGAAKTKAKGSEEGSSTSEGSSKSAETKEASPTTASSSDAGCNGTGKGSCSACSD